MTATEMATLLGKMGSYPALDMWVTVQVTDVRKRFGDVDVLITPDSGTGSSWVRLSSIRMGI